MKIDQFHGSPGSFTFSFFCACATLVFLFFSGLTYAQSLPDLGNPQALSGAITTSAFHGAATADGGANFGTAFQQTDNLVIQAEFVPEISHRGSSGNLFAIAIVGDVIYVYFQSTGWQVWDGTIPGLGGVDSPAALSEVHRVDISGITDVISGEGNITVAFFLAYDTDANPGELYYSGNPLLFTVTVAVDYNAAALELFENNLATSVIQTRCIACHVEGGIGRSTGLVFQRETTASTLNNFNVFDSFLNTRDDALEYILSKASGNDHTGGIQLPKGGSEYNNLQEFLATLTDSVDSNESPSASDDFFSAVTTQPNTATLRRAAIILAGRLPTDAETAKVSAGDDNVLRGVLRGLMQGDGFHQFLTDGANDRLLTRGVGNLPDGVASFPAFTNRIVELGLIDFANGILDGRDSAVHILGTQLGLEESPLELIAYVVENDRPYSEILTADYMMLNPGANFSVGGTAIFDNPENLLEFQPGVMTGYYRLDDSRITENVPEINQVRVLEPGLTTDFPHTGILNTQAFLLRYPSTATNRNRARARWTFLHFLDVDIEKSAQRSTDPVALADTNNPTMNNPNCTVCHATMDPVAGAFQNYSDEGQYRAGFGGLDSLDNGYKYPEDGSSSEYQDGDSWNRDMRTPGLFDTVSPDPEVSLQWLAQQIVEEPGFATATVKFWWPAIMGNEVLRLPQVEDDSTYQAHLAAYDVQSSTIQQLVSGFQQSDMSLKDLLVDMLMSPWFRADSADESELSSIVLSAHELSNLGREKLLTPERLARKTAAITSFNWQSFLDTTVGDIHSGLDSTYRLYYGGIDSKGVTKRSTELTPLMSTVAMSHALESACPIVLREFALPDGSRMLFNDINSLVTPLTEALQQYQLETDANQSLSEETFTVDLAAGDKNVVLSIAETFCDWDETSQSCRTETYLSLDKIEIIDPRTNVRTRLTAGENSCGLDIGSTSFGVYLCKVDFPFNISTAGEYTVALTSAAMRTGVPNPAADFLVVDLSVEADVNVMNSTANGAVLIKQKLVELHDKMLGKTHAVDSLEIEDAYQLFIGSWEERRSSNEAGNLTGNSNNEVCNWYSDYNFPQGLLAEGTYHQVVEGEKGFFSIKFTENAWNDISVLGADPLHTKQAWVTVITYLLSHYNYLYE